jgi:ribonuclease T1
MPSRSSSQSPAVPASLDGFATVSVAALPAQAQETLRLIDAGGPFPYRQDGVVFGNRERLLPSQKNGYYHEYTVRTPGSQDRGARRIITGGPAERYYTDDHYASFRRILS